MTDCKRWEDNEYDAQDMNAETGAITDAYSAYMRDVDKVSRLSNKEQAELQYMCRAGGVESCRRVAAQATLLVAYVVAKMRRHGSLPTVTADDLDAIQEGNIAALEALPKWDPMKGTLGTYLVPQIRGKLLNYANTHLNAGIGSKHTSIIRAGLDEPVAYDEIPSAQDEPGAEQAEAFSLEESLTYDRPVLSEPDSEWDRAVLAAAIQRLPQLLKEVLMLNLWGNSVEQIAKLTGLTHETARRRLKAAVEAVRVEISP